MNQVATRTGEATIRQLTEEECRDRLATATVGRVGYVTPQGLQILPVSYRSAGATVMLRTTPRSSLAQLGEMGRPVTFEVDDHDPDFELAWSVLMHGTLRELDEDGIQRLAELDPPVEPWPGDVASHPLEFVPHEFAGRMLEHRWTSKSSDGATGALVTQQAQMGERKDFEGTTSVLVCFASRMGSTEGIAQAIGQQLQAAGFEVAVHDCEHAPDARNFDAVVLGSAIYLRRWRPEALRYLRTQAPDLAERPTWLFQSGPCGEGSEDESVPEPLAVRRLTSRIGLRPPTTFGGRLERATAVTGLSRWMADGALAGDFRDWERIRRWTDDIIADLTARQAHRRSWSGGRQDH